MLVDCGLWVVIGGCEYDCDCDYELCLWIVIVDCRLWIVIADIEFGL